MPRWLSDPHLFANLSILLSLASTARYAYQGDWGRAVYWGAAATITIAATHLIRH